MARVFKLHVAALFRLLGLRLARPCGQGLRRVDQRPERRRAVAADVVIGPIQTGFGGQIKSSFPSDFDTWTAVATGAANNQLDLITLTAYIICTNVTLVPLDDDE